MEKIYAFPKKKVLIAKKVSNQCLPFKYEISVNPSMKFRTGEQFAALEKNAVGFSFLIVIVTKFQTKFLDKVPSSPSKQCYFTFLPIPSRDQYV